MKPNRIEAALATLITLIEAGMEYPDASCRAGEKHALGGRQYDLLTEAYDAWCIDIESEEDRVENLAHQADTEAMYGRD